MSFLLPGTSFSPGVEKGQSRQLRRLQLRCPSLCLQLPGHEGFSRLDRTEANRGES